MNFFNSFYETATKHRKQRALIVPNYSKLENKEYEGFLLDDNDIVFLNNTHITINSQTFISSQILRLTHYVTYVTPFL